MRILSDNGLAAGLHEHGREHDTCAFRYADGQFELNYRGLGRGEIRFETSATEVTGLPDGPPRVRGRGADGEIREWTGAYIAGCDGRNAVSRHAVPTVRHYRRDHGISWLAILAEAPQSMGAVAYATHDDGFAGHMARSATVTRYYLQCPPGDDPQAWTDQRIWDNLHRRMRADEYGELKQGPTWSGASSTWRPTSWIPSSSAACFSSATRQA